MTPEERQLLIETRDLSLENAKILRSIQRSTRASLVLKVLYWVVILGITFGAYYFIQPYIEFFMSSLDSVQSGATTLEPFSLSKPLKSLENIQSLYK